nr:uncharacterized protein LOC111414324 [Onthophagus taurus]
MELVKEKRSGLISVFTLKCKNCGIEQEICNDPISDNTIMDINSATVLATISTGAGYSTLEETHSVMSIPPMSNRRYNEEHKKLSSVVTKTAWATMIEAGKEEASLATQVGDVDDDGIPFITVIADGGWCKRSYKTNYNALSGVGCIIGASTGKLLYLGIRNKYCSVCARAESRRQNVGQHTCFKNWIGTSTSMEADIIVEGFKKSVEMHGVRFNRLVGDGDSSIMKKLVKARPYGNRPVHKIECRNHLLRNYCNKIREISKRPRSNSTNKPVPIAIRQSLKANILRLRIAIIKAMRHRALDSSVDLTEKVTLLKKDILNSPHHIFGDHEKCEAYYCTGPKPREKNLVPDMTECGVFQDLKSCLYRLEYFAYSLILNMTNNSAESYNSVVCKFIGGKRINFGLRNSYEMRCEAAGISYSSTGNYYELLHNAFNKTTSTVTKKYISKRKKILNKHRDTPRKKKRLPPAFADEDYGEEEPTNPTITDMPEEKFSDESEFCSKTGLVVEDCGLFIGKDEEYFLAASPDGVVGNDAIIKIKCPYTARDMTVEEAIEQKKLDYASLTERGEIILKENHNYMYQVQRQLHLSGRDVCYFIIWTKKNFAFQKIQKQSTFWENMQKNLKTFYFKCVLPELVDPRFSRPPPHNTIRNPDRGDLL